MKKGGIDLDPEALERAAQVSFELII